MEDIDAFSELTPQDVLEVVESVTKDFMSGLQVSFKKLVHAKNIQMLCGLSG